MAPIGAEHFTAEDGRLMTGEASQHPAYHILISARDMARFGLLMLRGGKWGERQVVSADWVAESTRDYSDASLYGADGYGYMWWVAKQGRKFPHIPHVELGEGAYSARGSRGHYLLVMPAHDMVIVHRVNTFERGNAVSGAAMGLLTAAVLNAKSAEGPILSSPTTEALDEYVGIYRHRPGRELDVRREGQRLFVTPTDQARVELIAGTKGLFRGLDRAVKVFFRRDETGKITAADLLQRGKKISARRLD